MNRRLVVVAVGAGVVLLGAGCGTGSTNPAAGTTSSPTASPTSLVVPTRAEVAAAMLGASDVPTGFKLSTAPTTADLTGKGPDPHCADLGKVIFSAKLPGSLFEVDREFDKADGSSISESVAPFATTAAAASMANRIGADISKCPELTATAADGTSITFKLSVAAAPSAGTLGTAVTLTGTGQAAGLVETSTTIVDGSTLISLSAPSASQADQLTTLALAKLDKAVTGAAS